LLADDAVVYKLIGPALIKQDLNDAKENVAKRLAFINTEMYVLARSVAANQAVLRSDTDQHVSHGAREQQADRNTKC
jgi:chaperonin cofactor prefoldin